MKDFSKTIDLGVVDCCAVRHGVCVVKFYFWFRQKGTVLDVMAEKEYAAWVVDALFGSRQEQLAEEAEKVAAIVMQQLADVDGDLEDNVAITINNPVLKPEQGI
jgi:hypothetical protein